uniref:Uncharacterized protein n=1 Tax=Moniliophthora roreri TaxID=221103 RepID=A0A0W0FXL9_MONRR
MLTTSHETILESDRKTHSARTYWGISIDSDGL